MTEVTKADIGAVIHGLLDAQRHELESLTQADLEKFWFYHHDPKRTPEHSAYEFFKMLELYRGQCRRWEEMHNDSCCVVERVRDTYLMPKIKQFVASLCSPSEADQPMTTHEKQT